MNCRWVWKGLAGLLLFASGALGAQPAPDLTDWIRLETDHFVLISQASPNRTRRLAQDLEVWRQVAAQQLRTDGQLPPAAVENRVYVLRDTDAFQALVSGTESGSFAATPRRNFLAIVAGDDDSLAHARHHYAHFLVRNFADLRTPRWYEEGLAAYLARLEIEGVEARLPRMSTEGLAALARLNPEVTVQELLYDETALASPRLIQIANLKSEGLLHFLLHAHQEEGFVDRRAQLQRYLTLALEGRSQRFAFDQAFDVNTRQLDEEYLRYLEQSRRPRGELDLRPLQVPTVTEAQDLTTDAVAEALAELALNHGQFALAEQLFARVRDGDQPTPRSHAGVADAQRMQSEPETRLDLLSAYEEAVALAQAGDRLEVLLDLGEYLETVLLACDVALEGAQRQTWQALMLDHFLQALALAPDHPEVQLALGQVYLLRGNDPQDGMAYQQRALSLLPADGFILEQAVKYAIAAGDYTEAERLIGELAQPLHFFGEPGWVTDLRTRLSRHRAGLPYDACENP